MSLKLTIVLLAVSVAPISSILGFNLSIPESNGDNSEILSRRKRFLIFPDGSSFQFGKY